ncbi:hypothetical protein ACVWZA_001616 [Sphingomonas sp. UYAg733]
MTKFRLPAIVAEFGIAIFPCLKTSNPIRIGEYTFSSTTDLSGLPDDQAAAVSELAAMLYARDDVRIAQASYAITEPLGVFRPGPVIERLDRVRAVVGYLYSGAHPTFGDAFMPFEFASMAVIQPANVSTFLVRPDHGTILPPAPEGFVADEFWHTPGYEGTYNRRPVWLAKGSRLYGGHTYTPLNIAQDLYSDIGGHRGEGRSRALLLELLHRPITPFGERIFIALGWYNDANDRYADPDKSLLSLAVAFEVLLELPSSDKTDRLSDSISLLLGRTARVKDWAVQFYAARSQVAHEGRVRDWWFYSAKPTQKGQPTHRSGSVMTYGLEIFQLCLATILTGGKLAEQSGLAERFIANSERYAEISERLGRASGSPEEAIAAIEPLVEELNRFQFVSSPTSIEEVIKALRAAAKALGRCDVQFDDDLTRALKAVQDTPKGDEFATLSALEALEKQMQDADRATLGPATQVVGQLVEVGWRGLFMILYRLKDQRAADIAGGAPPT